MANDEYKKYILKHRKDFIALSDKQEVELARLYISTAAEIKERAELIINKKGLSYAAAKIRIKSLLREASRLSDGFKRILDKSLIESADLGKEVNALIMEAYQDSLKDAGYKLNLTRMLSKVSNEAVKAVYSRIWNDGLKLSDRIWLLDRRSKQEIERIVMSNIISGGSASNKVTLSALDNLLNPSLKKAKLTSLHGRKVGYESSRLLRTSTSEAFNEGDRMSNNANPGVSGETWLASPNACDDCVSKDGRNVNDVGYPPTDSHPNCRCTTLAIVQSVEQFTNNWIDYMHGGNHPDLDKWYNEVYKKAA
jgi:hypothetical protein